MDKAYEESFEKLLHRDWERARKKVFQELGQHHTPWTTTDQIAGLRMSQFSASPVRSRPSPYQPKASTSTISSGMAPTIRDPNSGMNIHPRFRAYAKIVREMNEKRRTGQDVESIVAFYEAAAGITTNDASQRMLLTCWTLLFRMLGGDPTHARDPTRQPLKARQFAKVHSEKDDSPAAVEFRQTMLDGARTWFQDSYYRWLSEEVRAKHANIGGIPSVQTEVKAFLEMRFQRNGRWANWIDTGAGHPFWAHVFTLVRCGLYKQAVEHIDRNAAYLDTAAPDFAAYFRAWTASDGSHRLPTELRTRLLKEWNNKIREHVNDSDYDPFKIALYKIIGRCELNTKGVSSQYVIHSAEDYTWFQLMLAQEQVLATDPRHERYTLRDIAVHMQSFGIAYFKNPVMWFQILMVCGEFELAVSELLKQEAFSVDAIHFAITMVHYGVLRVTDSPYTVQDGSLLVKGEQFNLPSGTPYQMWYFNFGQLISACVGEMGKDDPVGALHYVFLLGLLGEPLSQQDASISTTIDRGSTALTQSGARQYTSYTHKLISEVVLASGEFEALLGEVRPNGTRVPGEAERFQSLVHIYSAEQFKHAITIPAAEQAEREGRFQNAIRLHHLAGEPGRVVEILNRQLSERLAERRYRDESRSTSNGPLVTEKADVFSSEGDPTELAQQVLNFYQSHPHMLAKTAIEARQTCELLTALLRFMQMYERGTYEAALSQVLGTGLVPTKLDMGEIQQKANEFKRLSDPVTKIMPDVLLAASEMLYQMFEGLVKHRVSAMEASVRDRRLAELRELAKALTLFAGSLQYRIPGDTLTTMNRMLVMMG